VNKRQVSNEGLFYRTNSFETQTGSLPVQTDPHNSQSPVVIMTRLPYELGLEDTAGQYFILTVLSQTLEGVINLSMR